MKKLISTISILLLFAAAYSQTTTPKGYAVKLVLQSTAGTNSSAVTYNSDKGMYYTIIAGNADYPIDVFDVRGVWQTSITAGQDMRGMWYNATTNSLEGNNTDGELYSWGLNSNGQPSGSARSLNKNMTLPVKQCVGFSNGASIFYYNNGAVYSTSASNPGKMKKLKLAMQSYEIENYNEYTMGYSGVAGHEIVLLNYSTQSAAIFNKKGKFVTAVKLPEDTPAGNAFRFSYCNSMAWLYDADARTWYGYRIF